MSGQPRILRFCSLNSASIDHAVILEVAELFELTQWPILGDPEIVGLRCLETRIWGRRT